MYFCPFSTFTICHRITINSRVEVTLYIELSGANCFIVKILEHLFFDRAFLWYMYLHWKGSNSLFQRLSHKTSKFNRINSSFFSYINFFVLFSFQLLFETLRIVLIGINFTLEMASWGDKACQRPHEIPFSISCWECQ